MARNPFLRSSRRRAGGMTLVELLVALAVFAVVIALAGAGVVQTLRLQRLNEAVTSAQTKLRRATEVVAQDMRSLALGAIVDAPYESGPSSVSFTIPNGPPYSVYPHDSGQNASFVAASNVQIGASADSADELGLEGRQVAMKNVSGDAIVLTIDSVARRGGATSREWNLVHPGCTNTIDYTDNTVVLQRVESVGYAFDEATGRLMRRTGSGDPEPLAFGITRFALRYVYLASDGSIEFRDDPIENGDGVPLRRPSIGGVPHVLDAIRIEIATTEPGPSGDIERSYVSQVGLPETGSHSALSMEVCP